MIIDGREMTPAAGESVLEAAGRAGVRIPTLCHHPALPPDGSCRVCLVEVAGRGGLHPACVLPAADAMVVHTDTAPVREARATILRLLLSRYEPRAAGRRDELAALAARHGVAVPAERRAAVVGRGDSNPFIAVDLAACVRCWRCVRACALLNGVAAIGVFGRGDRTHVGFWLDGPSPIPIGASSCWRPRCRRRVTRVRTGGS